MDSNRQRSRYKQATPDERLPESKSSLRTTPTGSQKPKAVSFQLNQQTTRNTRNEETQEQIVSREKPGIKFEDVDNDNETHGQNKVKAKTKGKTGGQKVEQVPEDNESS